MRSSEPPAPEAIAAPVADHKPINKHSGGQTTPIPQKNVLKSLSARRKAIHDDVPAKISARRSRPHPNRLPTIPGTPNVPEDISTMGHVRTKSSTGVNHGLPDLRIRSTGNNTQPNGTKRQALSTPIVSNTDPATLRIGGAEDSSTGHKAPLAAFKEDEELSGDEGGSDPANGSRPLPQRAAHDPHPTGSPQDADPSAVRNAETAAPAQENDKVALEPASKDTQAPAVQIPEPKPTTGAAHGKATDAKAPAAVASAPHASPSHRSLRLRPSSNGDNHPASMTISPKSAPTSTGQTAVQHLADAAHTGRVVTVSTSQQGGAGPSGPDHVPRVTMASSGGGDVPYSSAQGSRQSIPRRGSDSSAVTMSWAARSVRARSADSRATALDDFDSDSIGAATSTSVAPTGPSVGPNRARAAHRPAASFVVDDAVSSEPELDTVKYTQHPTPGGGSYDERISYYPRAVRRPRPIAGNLLRFGASLRYFCKQRGDEQLVTAAQVAWMTFADPTSAIGLSETLQRAVYSRLLRIGANTPKPPGDGPVEDVTEAALDVASAPLAAPLVRAASAPDPGAAKQTTTPPDDSMDDLEPKPVVRSNSQQIGTGLAISVPRSSEPCIRCGQPLHNHPLLFQDVKTHQTRSCEGEMWTPDASVASLFDAVACMCLEGMRLRWWQQFVDSPYFALFLRLWAAARQPVGLSSFDILKRVGKGGFGTVYRTFII